MDKSDEESSLTFVGIGLSDHRDITLRGLYAIREADHNYFDVYTCILSSYKRRENGFPDIENLHMEFGVESKFIEADRYLVEADNNEIINNAKKSKVCILIVGDPLCATTHIDLYLRAKESGISKIEIIHNASIISAVSCTGLQIYRFGRILSMCIWSKGFHPDSYYEGIQRNMKSGNHTLLLLDIKTKEKTIESVMSNESKTISYTYEEPIYMTCGNAINQLKEVDSYMKRNKEVRELDNMEINYESIFPYELKKEEVNKSSINSLRDKRENGINININEKYMVAVARIGSFDQKIIFGTSNKLLSLATTEIRTNKDEKDECIMSDGNAMRQKRNVCNKLDSLLGPPPHSLIICSELHDLELSFLRMFEAE